MGVQRIESSLREARERLDRSLRRTEAEADTAIWIHRLSDERAHQQLNAAAARMMEGVDQPLFGLTFAIKDNIDLAGAPTTAACPEFSYLPTASATVVQQLCDAGAIALGKTNLDQFATGLVGVRSPYGVAKNPFDPAYIAGGSSSGSAVAVATEQVDFSLGTDTAGSGRVPAGFCNIVGVKPTRGLLSTTGVVPACRSLDCVSIFARSCELAGRVVAVARGFDRSDVYSRRPDELPRWTAPEQERLRVGVPQPSQLQFFGDEAARSAYRRAVDVARNFGATIIEIDFAPFADAAAMLYAGPWVSERYLACRSVFDRKPEALLPVIREIIGRAAQFSAADAFLAEYQLRALRRASETQWERMDALLLPTTGTIYRIDRVLADPIQLNTDLGHYTNFANLLDLAAVAVPNGFRSDGLPIGITWVGPAASDDWLLQVAQRFMGAAQGELP